MGQPQLPSPPAAPALLAQLLQQMQSASGVFPLSPIQESLWVAEQMAPGQSTYNLPEAWRLRGQLNLPALEWSLEELLRRHEPLRTSFGVREGKPMQIIQPPQPFHLLPRQVPPGADPETELARLMSETARCPFDLERGPLVRFELFRLAATEQVLVINLHHIISDAWSQGVLMRELTELYRARVEGRPSPLRELPIQYADYAVWQRNLLAGPALEKQLAFWKEKLRGPLLPVALPTDHPRPATVSCRGQTQFFTLPPVLTESLRELSRKEGVTLYMTVLAAFKTLLHRYTRQEDLVVGAPMAGRERVETEGLLGFFVNTLPLRTDLGGDPAFLELLTRVREVVLEAAAHQEVSLEQIAQAVQPERDPSRHALFQVVFGLQGAAPESYTLPGLEATLLELDNGASKFDWSLLLTESPSGLRVRSEYCADLFDVGTMQRLARQFQILLEAIVAEPRRQLSELPLLTPGEQAQLLEGGKGAASAYERDAAVHELFERQAGLRPEATALVFEGGPMTYGELNRQADELACRLRACGVGPEVLVGLCLERSPQMVMAMLAILKAGGAYLPLDRAYPQERIAWMLADAAAPVLLTDSRFEVEMLQTKPAVIIRLDAPSPAATPSAEPTGLGRKSRVDGPQPEAAEPSARACATAEHLAYVMYTSGSTGTPKGTLISHRGVVRLVRQTNYLEFSPDDVFLQLAPSSFDASTLEIWGPLLNGARLVIFPPHLPSLEELARVIVQQKVTTLWLTAGLFHQMVDHHLESLRGLRWLLAGGDVLSVPQVVKVARELDHCQLINGYGPTENTTFTCCYRVPAGWSGGQSVPIGRPIANTQVYVLDERLVPVPVGMPGELYVGGDGLARGYLERPELTLQKFIPNPFRTGGSGEVLYRSGDLVRWLPDGNLEFLGRLDDQVKIRGYRIEPGEIEAVLTAHPAVGEAVVAAREDQSGSKQLVAYVVLWPGREVAADQLQQWLAAKLPAHMVPSYVMPLAALPLTANGKVDRRALPSPAREPGAEAEAAAVAPRNRTEEVLAEIWCQVLGRKHVGIHQNFFHLGGHSLLATQVLSRVARELQVEVPVRALFEAPTIARLAEAVQQAEQQRSASPPPLQRQLPPERAAELLGRLDQLTDEEVEQLLSAPEWKNVLS